jgi:hypothetical protein
LLVVFFKESLPDRGPAASCFMRAAGAFLHVRQPGRDFVSWNREYATPRKKSEQRAALLTP